MDEDYNNLESFEADETTIVGRKIHFIRDGGSFLYLRKGEDVGAQEIAMELIKIIQSAASSGINNALWYNEATEIAAKVAATLAATGTAAVAINKLWKLALDQYDTLKDNIKRTRDLKQEIIEKLLKEHKISKESIKNIENWPYPKDFRIICKRDQINELAIQLFKLCGARIRHRPKEENSGTHRFYVNDKRICFFYRTSNDKFIGVTGHNELLEKRLKEEFLAEWELYPPDIKE